jgi:hypothetical protein
MKAADVVRQLMFRLPFYTDKFTDTITVDEITSTGTTATVKTIVPHTLNTGDYAHISGALVPRPITIMTQIDGIAEAETATNHDLTFGYSRDVNIEIIGTNESEYNGAHKLLEVPNRKNFKFEVDSGAVSPATGSPLLLENLKRFTYNGWHKITKVNDTEFTFPLEITLGSPAYGNIKMQIKPRIAGALDLERARESYTRQPPDKLWAYVVLENIIANKDRNEDTDATKTNMAMTQYRQLIIQPFYVYVFVPVTHHKSASFARDEADDLLIALNKSLLRFKFTQPTFELAYSSAIFSGSDFGLDENSYYTHAFIYETSGYLTYQDTIDDDISVAFRDIYGDMESSLSDDELIKAQFIANLDNEPLNT